jgi:hypothetical protein
MSRVVVALALFALSGCTALVGPAPPAAYDVLGPTHAEACDFLLFNQIPILGLNRTERAYTAAIQRLHATALIDTSIKSSWVWAGVGTLHCSEVSGTAIRAN